MEYNYFLDVITTTTDYSTKVNEEGIDRVDNSLRVEYGSGFGCLVSWYHCRKAMILPNTKLVALHCESYSQFWLTWSKKKVNFLRRTLKKNQKE